MFESLIHRLTKCRKGKHVPAFYDYITSWMDGAKKIHVKNVIKTSCVHCRYEGAELSTTEKVLKAGDLDIKTWGRLASGITISGWFLKDMDENTIAKGVTSTDSYGEGY